MNYVYIYKDANNHFQTATSMPFIASHTKCRALPLDTLPSSFDTWADLLYDLNNYEVSYEATDFVASSVLQEIYY